MDEDNFEVEDDQIQPEENFLKNVEEKLAIRGDIPAELERLDEVRNKILERVKQKKIGRKHGRRDSMSSVGSTGSKRGNSELAGGDSSRAKVEQSSSLPNLVKTQQ